VCIRLVQTKGRWFITVAEALAELCTQAASGSGGVRRGRERKGREYDGQELFKASYALLTAVLDLKGLIRVKDFVKGLNLNKA